jgi:glycosyltransferase involved in cell wall biosynthesis
VARVRSALARGLPCELIVVDDGSEDRTAAVVRGTDGSPVGLVVRRFERNRGKGAAVRGGRARSERFGPTRFA